MTNLIVIIGVILGTISKYINNYITIMLFRFFAGIYSGMFSGILPLYLSECSSRNLRGRTGSMNHLGMVVGNLAVNIVGLPYLLGSSDLWPILVALTILPAFSHIFLVFLSESPKFVYINKNRKEQARESKSFLFHLSFEDYI